MIATAENGWELSVTRHIAAPPEKVWDIMTNRITEWWCPKPWTTEFAILEWRTGGRKSGVMRGPNAGEESPMEGIFLEVTPQQRFVFTNVVNKANGDWMPDTPFMIGGFEIAPDGDGTRYFAWSRHWDEATAKKHNDMGFADGWGACADQLAVLCEM